MPGAWFWGCILAVSLILSLGAHPIWHGAEITSVTLPFALVERLPVLSLMRLANRYFIVFALALALVAAMGWASL